jgi:uncharacterized protein (DUF58 family)
MSHNPPTVSATLDPCLLARIKEIQILARHLVNDIFAGEYQSAFKGRGMTFDAVREYQIGDDIRAIDWNVTARTNRPHIKIYRDERELTIMFLVDISGSSHFGTARKFKHEIAAEITALLAYTALKQNDRVGLLIFSDRVEHYIPPKKGRGHTWRLIRDILTFVPQSKKTDFSTPIQFLNRVVPKRAVTFLISDFQGCDPCEGVPYESELRNASRRHDLIAIVLSDLWERQFPPIGFIELEDLETGEMIVVNTKQKRFQDSFVAASQERLQKQRQFFRSAGIDFIEIATDLPYRDPILKFFRRREKTTRGRT